MGSDAGTTAPASETSGMATHGDQGSAADLPGADDDGDSTVGASDGPTDPPTTATAGGPDSGSDADPTSGGQTDAAGSIDVTLSGCSVDFSGEIVVSYNGSLGVASVLDQGGSLTGSFQFDLDGPDTFVLSSQHRVDTGTVINMVDPGQGTWTNLDGDALAPGGIDTIGGTLDVSVWAPARGQAVLTLSAVTLENVVDGSLCTIDGTIEADHLYP